MNTLPVFFIFNRKYTRAGTTTTSNLLLGLWRGERSTEQVSKMFTEYWHSLHPVYPNGFFLNSEIPVICFTFFFNCVSIFWDPFTFFLINHVICLAERTIQLGPITIQPPSKSDTTSIDSKTAQKSMITWDSGSEIETAEVVFRTNCSECRVKSCHSKIPACSRVTSKFL